MTGRLPEKSPEAQSMRQGRKSHEDAFWAHGEAAPCTMTGNRHFAAPEVRSGPFWAMPDAALQVKKASCLKMAHICLLSVFCSLDVS